MGHVLDAGRAGFGGGEAAFDEGVEGEAAGAEGEDGEGGGQIL